MIRKKMMNYTRKIDTDKAVEVQISSFTGKGGTTEYQVMVSITDPCLSFVEQLQNLLRVYVTVVKEELSNDATAVFRRYFLSDAANQTDNVMEWECESVSALYRAATAFEWNKDRYVDLFANGHVGTNARFRFAGSVA